MRNYHTYIKYSFILFLLILISCSPVRKLDDNQVFLRRNSIVIDKTDIDKSSIKSFVRPKANKRFLGFKFHLFLYNLSGKSDNGFNRWLRKIGEAPVVIDQNVVDKSTRQVKAFLFKKGYFDAEVTDSVYVKNRKGVVNYVIKPNIPYRLNRIDYEILDPQIRDFILSDSSSFLLSKGDIFDEDLLLEQMELMENKMQNNGYHLFNKNNISISADTTIGNRSVNLKLLVSNPINIQLDGSQVIGKHRKYKIGGVNFFVGYEPSKALVDSTYFDDFKEISYSDISYFWINTKKLPVNKKILEQTIFFEKGDFYSEQNVEKSHNAIQRLGIFKYVNIEFSDASETMGVLQNDKEKYGALVCNIYLTLKKPISFRAEMEGTNSDGEFGMAGSFSFKHRNIFRGADLLNLKFRGAFEGVKDIGSVGFSNALELGGELSLITSRLLMPGNTMKFIRRYNPKTKISSSYYYQRRPSYTRSVSNLAFGYMWSPSKYVSHSFNPIEYYKVGIFNTTEEFSAVLSQQPYLASSYIPHSITLTSYSFLYNNQDLQKRSSSTFFHFNLEIAGNILTGINSMFNSEKVDGKYTLFGTQYSQYIKSDIDLRRIISIDDNNSIATRLFVGVGYPFQNSETLPFEKRYFGGGSQGVRGWQVRTLGPGSFSFDETIKYPDQTADIKLEMNLEYRYKIFKMLEGAFFVDMGNIWDIKEVDERPGAVFKFDNFYNDIAVSSGVGLRLNLNLFIIRTDFGFKLRDPAAKTSSKWILKERSFGYDDWAFHFGIGYPF